MVGSNLNPGDRVSTFTRAWGDPWARQVHGRTWLTGVTQGTVLELLPDGRFLVDFGEADSEHAMWEAQALSLVSASDVPAAAMPEAAAATKRKAERKQAERKASRKVAEDVSDSEAVQCVMDNLIQRIEAEVAAEVWVRRAAADEDLILVQKTSQAASASRNLCGFRFVGWSWQASPTKPWGASIYDTATKKQVSHGYFESTWEAALKVARVLGAARCRELEEERQQAEHKVVAQVLRQLVKKTEDEAAAEKMWHLLPPKDPRRKGFQGVADPNKPPGIVARRKLLKRHPSLQAWASEAVRRVPCDLRKSSALQGEAHSASLRWASHGRSMLLVNSVQELQRPLVERAAKVRLPTEDVTCCAHPFALSR